MFNAAGIDSGLKFLEGLLDKPEEIMRDRMKKITLQAHHSIVNKTPVHTGKAVRNWHWSVGSPSGMVFDAIDNGPTGQTSKMSLGTEPRRGPNQQASLDTLKSLSFDDPFQKFILNNNDPNIGALEYGQLPTPQTSRNSAGMVRITVQNLLLSLGG